MYVTALNTFASWSFKRHMCMKKQDFFIFFNCEYSRPWLFNH